MSKTTKNFEGGSITLNEGGPYVAKDGSAKVANPSVKITGISTWGTMDVSAFHSMLGKINSDKDFVEKLNKLSVQR